MFDPSSLVYLSPDGQTALETIDPTKTYVIGGFVDRSVNKVISLSIVVNRIKVQCELNKLTVLLFDCQLKNSIQNVDIQVVNRNNSYL